MVNLLVHTIAPQLSQNFTHGIIFRFKATFEPNSKNKNQAKSNTLKIIILQSVAFTIKIENINNVNPKLIKVFIFLNNFTLYILRLDTLDVVSYCLLVLGEHQYQTSHSP
jgi:hypothetical protein